MRRIAVEDPSDDASVHLARGAGLEVIGIPVDESGIDVAALARTRASGPGDIRPPVPDRRRPPPDRRAALVEWAAEGDRFVIEDDYDAEFRYDREPIGAIQGLAPDRVVYVGSASKTLAPGLRLGWLLAPGEFVERSPGRSSSPTAARR